MQAVHPKICMHVCRALKNNAEHSPCGGGGRTCMHAKSCLVCLPFLCPQDVPASESCREITGLLAATFLGGCRAPTSSFLWTTPHAQPPDLTHGCLDGGGRPPSPEALLLPPSIGLTGSSLQGEALQPGWLGTWSLLIPAAGLGFARLGEVPSFSSWWLWWQTQDWDLWSMAWDAHIGCKERGWETPQMCSLGVCGGKVGA